MTTHSISRPRHHVGDPAMRPLNVRERLFVDEYLVDLNGTRAAGRAGYSWPAGTGFRLLQRPHVVAAIQAAMAARAERVGITVDRVLQELCWMAFARLDSVASWGVGEDGKGFVRLRPSEGLSPMQEAVIAEVKLTAAGLGVRMHDKVEALTLLMRHLGMLHDRLDLKVPEETPESSAVALLAKMLATVPDDLRDQLRMYIEAAPVGPE